MEDCIPKKNKNSPKDLVHSILPLECPKKDNLKTSKYIYQTSYDTPGSSTSGKYVDKIPRFDPGVPEEWIILVDLVQKAIVGQNVTTGLPRYK